MDGNEFMLAVAHGQSSIDEDGGSETSIVGTQTLR